MKTVLHQSKSVTSFRSKVAQRPSIDSSVKKINSLKKLLKNAKINSLDKFVAIKWKRGDNLQDLQCLFDASAFGNAANLQLMRSKETSTAIMCQDQAKRFLRHLPKERLIEIKEQLGMIQVQLSKKAYKTPGVRALMSQSLAKNGIHLEVVFFSDDEIGIFVKRDQLEIAKRTLLDLAK